MSDGKVVVGVSASLAGLEALRFAVAEARRRHVVLVAVRAWSFNGGLRSWPSPEWERALADEARASIDEAFCMAVGEVPGDLDLVVRAAPGPAHEALRSCVNSPADLLVVGEGRRRWFSDGAPRDVGCPVVVVPRPEMARVVGRRKASLLRSMAG